MVFNLHLLSTMVPQHKLPKLTRNLILCQLSKFLLYYFFVNKFILQRLWVMSSYRNTALSKAYKFLLIEYNFSYLGGKYQFYFNVLSYISQFNLTILKQFTLALCICVLIVWQIAQTAIGDQISYCMESEVSI